MKITRNNYEEYFLDYYENYLTPVQVAELMAFLEENSDLREEFDEFGEMITLNPDTSIEFRNKNALKKKDITPVGKIDGDNYEEYFVAALEGDLSEKESADVSDFMNKNPETKLEYNALGSTFLKPENVVYKDKESLKKRGLLVSYRPAMLYAVSIAASILLFIGLYSLLTKENRPVREYSQINTMDIIEPLSGIAVPEMIITKRTAVQSVVSKTNDNVIPERETIAITRITPKEATTIETGIDSFVYFDFPAAQTQEVYASNVEPVETPKEKSFMSRFFSSLVKKVVPAGRGDKKSLIEYTVNGYNLMADRDVEVKKQYDSAGNIIAYNVVGENVEIIKRVKKPVRE